MMQYKRKSKIAVLSAAVLTSVLFGGTVFAGAYSSAPARQNDKTGQKVVYNKVEMRKYEGEDGHPYVHNIRSNNTARKITGYQRGMLAFDKDGNPLKIDWWSIDTDLDSQFFYLYENHSSEIAAGETDDTFGGWSLNLMGDDLAAAEITYVLYCDKEITFEDGTVWDNPDFENWRSAYEGKKIDVVDLESYYPYEQTIIFDN